MAARRRTTKRAPNLPPVGSLVWIDRGADGVVARVLEHRGPLGVGGRELIRVRYQFEGSADVVETELPLEEITLVVRAADPRRRNKAVEELVERARALPPEQQAELACEVFGLLDDAEHDRQLAAREWADEQGRRAVAAGSPGIPWTEVRARLLAGLRGA